ncbi:MAG: DUF6263 family protein, partial [Planctomycetota bacterium]
MKSAHLPPAHSFSSLRRSTFDVRCSTFLLLLLFLLHAAAIADEPVLLRYQFTKGEQVEWKVTHLGTTETKIQGNTQTSKSRSVSTKAWQVTDIDADGNFTFTHSVTNVNMWQQLSDRPEVRYNSESDTVIPDEYQQVAKTVGIPLATVTISPKGDIVGREGSEANEKFGVGGIIMLLPEKPVKAGSRWYEPSELHTRLPDGRVKKINIRKNYALEKVQTGVATISVKTEVLTPVNDARIESQLVQQLTDGTIKFDVDAGRVISKEMNWDETVVGFNGADSMMKYLARFTEELLPAQR